MFAGLNIYYDQCGKRRTTKEQALLVKKLEAVSPRHSNVGKNAYTIKKKCSACESHLVLKMERVFILIMEWVPLFNSKRGVSHLILNMELVVAFWSWIKSVHFTLNMDLVFVSLNIEWVTLPYSKLGVSLLILIIELVVAFWLWS